MQMSGTDFLDGADAIAEFMGVSPRRVYYLAETGQIPVAKIGNRLTGRKSRLTAHVEKLETATLAKAGRGEGEAA